MAKKQQSKDDLILSLKEEINSEKKELEKSSNYKYKTNCIFKINNTTSINLHAANLKELLVLLSSLRSMQTEHNIIFGESNFSLDGYMIEDWISDTISKIKLTRIKERKTKLENLESRLYSLLSQDKKVDLELDEIKKSINVKN